ncbi:ParB/RepB/Spo0J family partition protein [Agromyces sp. SYSU T00194]|uniref:ParB/RepB/Spo0J family partition protein n=1 Tax=Agromyces chitinivorans TaxID=3158560 RepID=UPI0033932CAF
MTPRKPTLKHLDPNLLTTEHNVRTDLDLGKDFLKSIREHGVLEPITAYPDPVLDDHYRVHIGHRRTAAAVKAGLDTVPVYVITERQAADRVAEQLTENQHRAALTTRDTAAAFEQLSLFGLPATQIARRTATPIKTVGAALAVAKSESAAAIQEQAPDLTLDVLAQIAEFDGDTAAVKELTSTATSNPGLLPHVIERLRGDRTRKVELEALKAQLTAAGIEQITSTTSSYAHPAGLLRLEGLVRADQPDVDIDTSDIHAMAAIPGIRAAAVIDHTMIDSNWTKAAFIRWYVDETADHGLVDRWSANVTDEQRAEREAAEAARQELQQAQAERDAQLTAAAKVRHAWLKELLDRKTLPDTTDDLIAHALASGLALPHPNSDFAALPLELLDIPVPDAWTWNADQPAEADRFPRRTALADYLHKHPARVRRVTFAIIASAIETDRTDHHDARYLNALANWGYGLSDIERELANPGQPQPEED